MCFLLQRIYKMLQYFLQNCEDDGGSEACEMFTGNFAGLRSRQAGKMKCTVFVLGRSQAWLYASVTQGRYKKYMRVQPLFLKCNN